MNRSTLIVTALVAFLVSGASMARAAEFTMDRVHSSVNFAIGHMMVSKVTGGFDAADAVIKFDEKDLANSGIDATVQVASVNTRNQKRDDHLRSADFFDAEKFPTIHFVSKKITRQDAQTYAVTGDLTMKGVTHEIMVPVTIAGPVMNPMSKVPTLGLEAHFKINRQDYGVTWNKVLDNGGLMVGNDVQIDVAIEADAK